MDDNSADPKPSKRADRLKSRSRERRDQARDDVRQVIMAAATTLFVEQGYQNFSLRQVAERIGYSPGTIYLYFQNKDEILMAIMQEGIARFSQMLTDAAATPDPRERLRQIGRAYVSFGVRNPAHYELMFVQRTDYLERLGSHPADLLVRIFELWRAVVEDAMRAGVLRMGDPISTGDTLWALLHGIVCVAILMPRFDESRSEQMIDTALEMLTTGLHRS